LIVKEYVNTKDFQKVVAFFVVRMQMK